MTLFFFMAFVGAVLTFVAFGDGIGAWARAGLAAGALSTFTVAWWCARYWYAAYCDGRRAEPVPEPNPWPWVLPWAVLVTTLAVTGIRDLSGGNSQGWFSIGFAGLLGLPAIGGLVALLFGLVSDARSGRRRTPPVPAEPERPRRDWGPIG
ncbi:hypothetical protein [Streptomyces silaceus]|nr:hypothetical protein [Streptomyces silaceus]